MTFFDSLWQRLKYGTSEHCALHPVFQPDCTACQLTRQRPYQEIESGSPDPFNTSLFDSSITSDSSSIDTASSSDAGTSDAGSTFDAGDSGFSGFDGGDSGGGGSSGDF